MPGMLQRDTAGIMGGSNVAGCIVPADATRCVQCIERRSET
jgi:hypothetical protein